MAWTNITNAQLAIGAPIRSIDLLALRDNIIAQANGDAGAPKQQAAGINFNTNGLQNSSGALAIACPAFNTVGSYCFGRSVFDGNVRSYSSGSNYAAGGGGGQIVSASAVDDGGTSVSYPTTNNLSGTWKFMSGNTGGVFSIVLAIFCRVS